MPTLNRKLNWLLRRVEVWDDAGSSKARRSRTCTVGGLSSSIELGVSLITGATQTVVGDAVSHQGWAANKRDRDVTGDVCRHHLLVRASLNVFFRCYYSALCNVSDCQVCWPTVSLFPAPTTRNDSSDTRAASVTLLDGLALNLFVLQAWPRRLRRKADQKSQNKWHDKTWHDMALVDMSSCWMTWLQGVTWDEMTCNDMNTCAHAEHRAACNTNLHGTTHIQCYFDFTRHAVHHATRANVGRELKSGQSNEETSQIGMACDELRWSKMTKQWHAVIW